MTLEQACLESENALLVGVGSAAACDCWLVIDWTTMTVSGSRSFSAPDATKPIEVLGAASPGLCVGCTILPFRPVPEGGTDLNFM